MLNRLHIRNYALIDTLDISFSKELNIITGETGAGKSIILGALSLILGQRAESRYFFNQQKKCIIEGFFQIEDYRLHDFFLANDLDYENETVLRREISADGKSRAFINDTPVNLSMLKQFAEQLIDIHSQHAILEINEESFQLLVVDTLAGHQQLLVKYQDTFKHYKRAKNKLTELLLQSEQAKSDADYYQFQFDELDNAKLRDGEQESLEIELSILSHTEEIKRNLSGAILLLKENDATVISKLRESLNYVQLTEKFIPELSLLTDRLQSTLIEIKDIAAELESIENQTVVDENRYAVVNERLDTLFNLQKKHRVNSVRELIDLHKTLNDKLNSKLSVDEEIDKLKAESADLYAELSMLAETLTASRKEIIPQVEQKTQSILTEIGMPHAVLKVHSNLLPEGEFTLGGRDSIRFLFSANKGQEPALMGKVASGGELSRLMLSIKSLISRHTALPTIIFDEIDTGISGEVAQKVGAIMEKLSTNMQVIAITHLPQIASKGNAHYRVYKEEHADRTLTNIQLLKNEERIIEIAQMLSGENPGEFALNNARELLQ